MPADPEHIAISKSKGISIDWKDGGHSELALSLLRDECPCATCTGAHGTEPQKSSYAAPSPLQMYKPRLAITTVEPVGHYAIRIYWSDGHNTGIYTWDFLRELGQREESKAQSSQ